MADSKISALTAATTTTGAELAGTQAGGNVRISTGLLQQSVRLGTVTATAHGFVAGDVLKLSGTTWSKAIATSVANATAIAVVESATTNTFVPVLAGRITLSGLTAGIYYLSDATAGLLTLTAPTTASSYLVPILRAASSTDAYVDIGSPLSLSLIQEADLAFAVGEATVASATTTDLGAATSQHISISGTTTITGFGTVAAGRRRYVRFAGALTLTHNATSLILPSGANITTVANDRLCALSLGSGNWLVYWYQRADGTALVGGGGGSGDVTAASSFGADNRIVRSDGTGKGVQASGAEIDDNGNVNVLGDGVQGSVTLADAHATDPKSISITVPATITNPYRLVLPGVIPTVGQGLRVASVTGEVVALENATIPSGGLTSYATASLPASPGTGATALCTDCLTISGTAGAPVYYDGTKWRIIGTLIEATTSKLTFARSLAATYGGSLRSDYCTAGNLLLMPTTYGTFGGASQTVGGATVHQMVELYVGSGAHASARWPYLAIPNPSSSTYNGGFYLGFSVRVDYVSDATDEYAAWFGITDQSAWGSGHPAAANMIAVGYDRGNSSTLNSGNSANFILLTRASSTNNYSSVSSVPISTSLSSPSLIEIYQSNGAAPPVVYINNDAGTTLTGTLPSVALYPWFGVLKTAGSFGRTVQLPRAFFMRF